MVPWGFNPRDRAIFRARASSMSSFVVFFSFARSMASASPLLMFASSANFSALDFVEATLIQPEDIALSMVIASVYPLAFPLLTVAVFTASGM